MADNSNWDKTIPSGTSSIANGDDAIRSFKSSMQAWWEDEHYGTDGSASSAGEHKEGSARAYVGTASSVSTTADSGRLMWTTDAAQLHYVGHDSIHTMPSLGTSNIFLSQQSFNGGIFTSDITARAHNSASTFTGSVAHHDTVIASTVSTEAITGLSALSVSRVTTANLTVDAANGATLTAILKGTLSLSTFTVSAGDQVSWDVTVSGVTDGDVLAIGVGMQAVPAADIIVSASIETNSADVVNVMFHNTDGVNDRAVLPQDLTVLAFRA